MTLDTVKTTDEVISCSDNGQHPLIYINLKSSSAKCHYCGQRYERVSSENVNKTVSA